MVPNDTVLCDEGMCRVLEVESAELYQLTVEKFSTY